MNFKDDEWSFIAQALRSAAAKYMECASELVNAPGHTRLVDQFKSQHQTAIDLAERIETEFGC